MSYQSSQDPSEIDTLELRVSAEMARQYAGDAHSFLRSLAQLLESTMPGEATIQRAGLFGGDKRPIRKIEVEFDPGVETTAQRYVLEVTGHGAIAAARTQIVRGVALKTQSIPVPEWIAEVAGSITHRAGQNKIIRDALSGML